MTIENKTHLETLQEKMAKLTREIDTENARAAIEAKTEEIQTAVREAVSPLIGELPTTHGLWVVNDGKGAILVSIIQSREDGMPKAQQTRTGSTGNGNGNGTGYLYTLKDGQEFDTCEKAVNALGIETRDDKGEWLDGKKYYGRLDRLPKEVAEKITKSEKPTAPADAPDATEVSTNGASEATTEQATS